MEQDPILTYNRFDIAGIPTVVTEDHHEVFPFWVASGIRNATLFHIDYHPDMQGFAPVPKFEIEETKELSDELVAYTRELNIANFICPAIEYNIFESGYWLNPYFDELSDMGKTDAKKRHDWGTKIEEIDKRVKIYFKDSYYRNSNIHYYYSPKKVKIDELLIAPNMILDIDLDGFLVDDDFIPRKKYLVEDVYGERLLVAKKILITIPKPKLITITRSQGTTAPEPHNHPFVPPEYVDKVQKDTINMLKELYN